MPPCIRALLMEENMYKIVLDPGHGQFANAHTVVEGVYEGTQNFKLAHFLAPLLRERGVEVYVTREKVEDDPELEARGRLAGEVGADLFISLHSNAPGANHPNYSGVRGSEVFYSVSDMEFNPVAARIINDAVVKAMNTEDRGIKIRRSSDNEGIDYYSVLRNSVKYGCRHAFLIEHGFHTNEEDSAVLRSDEGLMRIAEAECEAIMRVLAML